MPELPEVETVRRQLEKAWIGRTIVHVHTSLPSYFFVTSPRVLKSRLSGQTLTRLDRHGKYLIAHFLGGGRLLLHLGMTGQLVARQLVLDPHVHLVLSLSKEQIISFRDVRKFGKVEWLAPGKCSPRLDKLGPDALSADLEFVSRRLRQRTIPIKTALLDQKIWAGVGNIYADEGLFAAGVRPTKSARRLTHKEALNVITHTRSILLRAVEHGGSTINDYIKADGTLGGYQNWHQVYGKEGEPCSRCGKAIVRTVLAARAAHFCAFCQK